MKTIILFIFLIISPTSIALTLGSSPCFKKWPKNTPSGKIKMTYEISKTCEPTKVNFIVSKPKGAFNDLVMCEIKQISLYWHWDNSETKETMTEEEYKKRTKEKPNPPPEKFNTREVHAVNNNGKTVKLACYFNKEGALTSRTVNNGKIEKTMSAEYINTLPEQKWQSEFKTEN